MSFRFDQDYLQDLEPVLSELREAGLNDIVKGIDECKAAGATGGEILSCINAQLRGALQGEPSKGLRRAINNYLKKAPGY